MCERANVGREFKLIYGVEGKEVGQQIEANRHSYGSFVCLRAETGERVSDKVKLETDSAKKNRRKKVTTEEEEKRRKKWTKWTKCRRYGNKVTVSVCGRTT